MYSVATNQDAHDAITAQFSRFKTEKTSRAKRLAFADQLTESYFALHGYVPPSSVLDRLATLILQDELADTDRMKMRNNEYPLLSGDQRKYREESELSVKAAQDVATDGVDYRRKTRDDNRRFREVFGS